MAQQLHRRWQLPWHNIDSDSIAFVIGNGTSRLLIDDLDVLNTIGTTYGCNALYRDFTPDVLVATDPEISTEIQNSGYPDNNIFYTREVIPGSKAIKIQKYYGFSSGPVALSLAVQNQHHSILMIGFDLGANEKGEFNNVYAGTKFYKESGAEPTYYGNWVDQIMKISQEHSGNIVRLVNDTSIVPKEWGKIRNMGIIEFLNLINNLK